MELYLINNKDPLLIAHDYYYHHSILFAMKIERILLVLGRPKTDHLKFEMSVAFIQNKR